MEKEPPQEPADQWRGEVVAGLPATPAGAAWPHVAAFCALDRYMPSIDVCERVAGADGQPGCIRHVAARESGTWAREELLAVDPAGMWLSYAVVDSNMGFGRYVATLTVVKQEEGEAEAEAAAAKVGCKIVWAFECEPVKGWSKEELVGHLDASVKGMGKNVEDAARQELSPAAPDA